MIEVLMVVERNGQFFLKKSVKPTLYYCHVRPCYGQAVDGPRNAVALVAIKHKRNNSELTKWASSNTYITM